MRRFVVGDIHGGFRALTQVLERTGFDPENALLISLGDVVDGWPDSYQCIDFLLELPHRVWVRGNHDQWFIDWLDGNGAPPIWTEQGGAATLKSYQHQAPPPAHVAFARESIYFYELDNMAFIHGGFDPRRHPRSQPPDVLMWDRSLIDRAYRDWRAGQPRFGTWDKVFLGHTPVTRYGLTEPARFGNLVGMDTGGGWGGRLSLMDIDTGQFWQSDQLDDLYAGIAGRGAAAILRP